VLLIEVIPSLLGGPDSQPVEARYLSVHRLWRHELAVLERYNVPVADLRRDWWQSWLAPCYVHRLKIVTALRGYFARHIDDWGWHESDRNPTVTPQTRQEGVARARREHYRELQDLRLGGPACRALRDLLEACRAEGIATRLLWMPEGTVFRGWYPPAVLAQLHAFLDELHRDYDSPLIDAREWVADEDFSDSHHLLPSGAAVFTERLGRDVGALLPYQPGFPQP
jgi:hypothetical protein